MPSAKPPSTEVFRVRAATRRDLPRILAIERASYPTPWPRESFLFELSQPQGRNFVACCGAQVVGYVFAWLVAEELKINNIAVAPAHRGCGIGSTLLDHVLRLARQEGCEEATLEVRPSNIPARRLYAKFGFREVGLRRGYYRDTGEDAILMARPLRGQGE